jgi:hypothetical protein
MSRNTRTSLENNSEILMPVTISGVPHENWRLTGSDRNSTQTDRLNRHGFLQSGDKVLVRERKREWHSGTVKMFADSPRSLLVQDDTSNRVYRRNTKHVKKTNTMNKRKAQKTMNWKKEQNGRKDEVTQRDTHPNTT